MLLFLGSQRLKPMTRHRRPGLSTTAVVAEIGDGPCVCDSHCVYDCRLRSCWNGGKPLHEYRFVKPLQPQVKKRGKNWEKDRFVLSHFKTFYFFSFNPQVDSFQQTRTWALQRHQNRFQNRSFPFQRSWSEFHGGCARKYGGTGVFLPRVSSTSTSSPSPTTIADLRKKQGELLPFFFFGHVRYIWCGYLCSPL